MTLKDFKVDRRDRAAIASLTRQLRVTFGIDHCFDFDIWKVLQDFRDSMLREGKPITLNYFNAPDPETYPDVALAKVVFKNGIPMLSIDRDVAKDAQKYNDPRSRRIIIHEIGHLVMHKHHIMCFSGDEAKHLRFILPEQSAEWQAERFEDYALLPDHIVRQFNNAIDISMYCNVQIELARRRLSEVISQDNPKVLPFVCQVCGNYSLVFRYEGTECKTCRNISMRTAAPKRA